MNPILLVSGIGGLVAFFLPYLSFLFISTSGFQMSRGLLYLAGIDNSAEAALSGNLISQLFNSNPQSGEEMMVVVGSLLLAIFPLLFFIFSIAFVVQSFNPKYKGGLGNLGIFLLIIYLIGIFASFTIINNRSPIELDFFSIAQMGFYLSAICMLVGSLGHRFWPKKG